jgi:hypothetical protein
MSDASSEPTTAPHRFLRALLLVAGVIAFLILTPKPARADGILDPVTDAVDQVTSAEEQAVQHVSTAVDDLASTVTPTLDVDQTVASTVGSAASTVGSAVATIDQVVVSVDQTAEATAEVVATLVPAASRATGAADAVVEQVGAVNPSPLPTGSDDPVPDVPTQAPPVAQDQPAHHRKPVRSPRELETSAGPSSVAVTGRSAAGSSGAQKSPATPRHGPVGAATPSGDGSPGPFRAGGPTRLAVVLVAVLMLAGASSRWLRLFALARAPDPFIPILVSPG